jgi:hypothetical protein
VHRVAEVAGLAIQVYRAPQLLTRVRRWLG